MKVSCIRNRVLAISVFLAVTVPAAALPGPSDEVLATSLKKLQSVHYLLAEGQRLEALGQREQARKAWLEAANTAEQLPSSMQKVRLFEQLGEVICPALLKCSREDQRPVDVKEVVA